MQIRVCLIALFPLALIAGGPAPSDPTTPDPAGSNKKEGSYLSHVFNAPAGGMAVVGAAINQENDTPHEWGQGMVGFGRRVASAFGKHIVHKTIQYPVSKLLHEELSYHPSGQERFGPRLKAALLGSVIRHKTTTGKSTLAVGEISGAFGSGLISRLWQPASTGSLAMGFESGGITLGIDTGMNVVKEFWPEIRHPRATRAEKARNNLPPLSPLYLAKWEVAPEQLEAAAPDATVEEEELIAANSK
jgi:hypothetical protein